MVAQIAEGHSLDHNGRPFPHRRFLPAIISLVVITLLSAAVWCFALIQNPEQNTATSCNTPPPISVQESTNSSESAAALGDKLSESEFVHQFPASLPATKVRVYNANGKQGQARQVSEQLVSYGFTPAPEPRYADDPIYFDQDLQCRGQIRFGTNGRAAAAALWLAFPCGELVEDKRQDDTVDLALGKLFSELAPSPNSEDALTALKNTRSGSNSPVSTDLLAAVHAETC
ncbi:MAG: envelope integrity protein Cei [Mycobacteriaceae bacterium]